MHLPALKSCSCNEPDYVFVGPAAICGQSFSSFSYFFMLQSELPGVNLSFLKLLIIFFCK